VPVQAKFYSMKNILIAFAILTSSCVFAQQSDSSLEKEVEKIKTELEQQQKDIQRLYSELNKEYRTYRNVKRDLNETLIEKQEEVIDSLNSLIEESNQKLNLVNEQLDEKIKQNEESTTTKITELNSSVDKNLLYLVIGNLGTLLLGGLIYWLLGKRISSSKTDVESQIRSTKNSLEEESVKLDNKLVEILETQLKLKQEEIKTEPPSANSKVDHALALKVADEIIRIQKNLSRMEEGTKGLKQLNSSVKRIQDNLAANDYEVVDMLGKEYNEGMKATVNFVQDDDFEEGKRTITRIIKPQVNYKGEMIQTAQIEVTEA
jgi:DNA anti-recombination protein RmuC